jgi:hypothetical protein
MAYRKKKLMSSDTETLVKIIEQLQLKLKKRKIDLDRTRTKLNVARAMVMRMRDTVEFQRKRIIELYP